MPLTCGYHEATEKVNARSNIGQQNAVSNDAGGGERKNREEALLVPVRKVCDNQVSDGPQGIAWNRERLDLSCRPCPETLDDGREKCGIAIEHGVDPKLAQGEHPDLPVFEGFHHVVLVQQITRGGMADLTALSHQHQVLLGGAQIVCRFR